MRSFYKNVFFMLLIHILCVHNVRLQFNTFTSPCPDVFVYESHPTDAGRWYGTISIRSDVTLYGLWIDILFDRDAESVENTLGDVITYNNKEFKLENKNQVLTASSVMSIRIFVKYNRTSPPPKIKYIRFNGRQVCADQASSNPRSQNINYGAIPLGTNDSDNKQGNRHATRSSSSNEVGPLNSGNDRNRGQNQRDKSTNTESLYRDTITNSNSNKNLYSTPTETNYNTNIQNRNGYNQREKSGTDNRDEYSSNTYNRNNDMAQSHPTNTYDRTYQQLTTTMRSTISRTNNFNYRHSTEDDDYADSSKAGKRDHSNDYFEGDFRLPPESKINPTPLPRKPEAIHECGKVAVQPTPLVVGGQATAHGQWPWHVALYQTQTVDSKYICGGSLVTTSHVITAAHCVTRKNSSRLVNAQTLTVYLGKYNLRKSSDSVQILLVKKIYVHPDYNATNFYADVSVMKLTKPSEYTIYVRPVCLWKESETDLSYVIDKEGRVVGWGFDEDGHVTEELSLVKMPVVRQSTCLWSFKEFYTHFTSEKSYCAGYENGTSVCNGDSGGGMVFPDYNTHDRTPIWRLRGLVSISVAKQNDYRCDPYHYVVFTDLAQFLDWIKQKLIE